jgi:hypothetical protein
MATSIDGHLLKTVSTPLDRLITEGYVPDENNQWDLVNVGFLLGKLSVLQGGVDADLLALFTMLSDAMGVKMVFQNVPLTLSTLPDLPTYALKNRERVLLIAQTDSTQNGFYEWQTGGTLVRLYEWRDVIAGNGISISQNNIAIKLLEYLPLVGGIPQRNDNFLRVDNQGKLYARVAVNSVGLKLNLNGELWLDTTELGGGSGGTSELNVANPDIDSVLNGSNQSYIVLANGNRDMRVRGGNFRTVPNSEVVLVSEGFSSITYVYRKHNDIFANVTVNNLIGSHIVTAKHLTLQSNDDDGRGYVDFNKITILGSAIIDTVLPKAKRGVYTELTITGEGFAVLSEWAANNSDIIIQGFAFLTRLLVKVTVEVLNTVPSGLYNLTCTNALVGLGSFTSGTSGNNKLEIFGDPLIETVFRSPEGGLRLAEVLLGETMEITCNGFDLTDDFSITPNSIATNGITINSTSGGLSTKKFINLTGSNNIADIGVYDLTCIDTVNGGDSGSTGYEKVALNYAYDNTTWIIPSDFRFYGGSFDSNDWDITPDIDGVIFEYLSFGTLGTAYVEINFLFLVASLLEYSLGWTGTVLEIECLTPVGDLDTSIGCGILVAPIGVDADVITPDYQLSIRKDATQPTAFRGTYGGGSTILSIPKLEVNIGRSGITPNTNFFATNNGISVPSGTFQRNYTAHENKAVHIVMNGNYRIKVKMKGWIGE